MSELVEWYRAQLAEDERVARAAIRAHEKAVTEFKRGRPADFEDLPGESAADWFGGTNEDEGGRFWCGLWAGGGIVSIAVMSSEYDTDTAEHIARYDPASVLRDVAAKRAIVDLHSERVLLDEDDEEQVDPVSCGHCMEDRPCPTLRLLASAISDRPGYREEWGVGHG